MTTERFSTSPDLARIAYDVYGAGLALLLLHGCGSPHQVQVC